MLAARRSVAAAIFAFPGLAPFLYQEVDDDKREHRVDPPGAEGELGGETQDHDE